MVFYLVKYQLFDQVRQQVSKKVKEIQQNARYVGELDCLLNFAQIAKDNNYTRPRITTDDEIIIKSGVFKIDRIVIPFDKIQNVNISRSVLERLLNKF